MKNKTILIIALIAFSIPVFAHQKSDSLIQVLETKLEKLEGFRGIKEKELNLEFNKLSSELTDKIKKDSKLINLFIWSVGAFSLSTVIAIFGLWWKGKKHIEERLNQKFDNIITEKRGDILALIDQQSMEKQFVKNKRILVLTAKGGDDTFLRTFFKTMEFPINNVNFEKVDKYQALPDFDLVFVNNEKGDLSPVGENGKADFSLIDQYFEKSSSKSVLFYFNSTRKNYINPKVENRLSFANAKTQIYGNLINLFRYQNILKQ